LGQEAAIFQRQTGVDIWLLVFDLVGKGVKTRALKGTFPMQHLIKYTPYTINIAFKTDTAASGKPLRSQIKRCSKERFSKFFLT
jgi:hypothetical protein